MRHVRETLPKYSDDLGFSRILRKAMPSLCDTNATTVPINTSRTNNNQVTTKCEKKPKRRRKRRRKRRVVVHPYCSQVICCNCQQYISNFILPRAIDTVPVTNFNMCLVSSTDTNHRQPTVKSMVRWVNGGNVMTLEVLFRVIKRFVIFLIAE